MVSCTSVRSKKAETGQRAEKRLVRAEGVFGALGQLLLVRCVCVQSATPLERRGRSRLGPTSEGCIERSWELDSQPSGCETKIVWQRIREGTQPWNRGKAAVARSEGGHWRSRLWRAT